MTAIGRALWQAIDLLDLTLLAAFSLITTGVYLLWGNGWATLTLGLLLLGLVLFGVPTPKPPSR
jgi:hypothetical protein